MLAVLPLAPVEWGCMVLQAQVVGEKGRHMQCGAWSGVACRCHGIALRRV